MSKQRLHVTSESNMSKKALKTTISGVVLNWFPKTDAGPSVCSADVMKSNFYDLSPGNGASAAANSG